jgi:acetyltransferase-like isoleucine patch superfamily enzyme
MSSERQFFTHPAKQSLPSLLKLGFYLWVEKLLRFRARCLKLLGAEVGNNVRIYEAQFFNLKAGFKNLSIGNDVHIGTGCRLDLSSKLRIGDRSTLSPGVTVLTHADPGTTQQSRILRIYPAFLAPCTIGSDCWLGANTIVLPCVDIGDCVVTAAGSVVTSDIPPNNLVAGMPAKIKRPLSPS